MALERIEISGAGAQAGHFIEKPELIEKPGKEVLFAEITRMANEVAKDNAALFVAAKPFEETNPQEVKYIRSELGNCSEAGISMMQKRLEELKLVGRN